MKAKVLDRVGVCASALCAVHCALTGLAMGLLAISGLDFLGNVWVEVAFVGTALVVGTWALVHGIRRHHSKIPATVFVLGIASIVASWLIGHGVSREHILEHRHESLASTIFAVAGGLLVVAFHLLNQRFQHRGCGCQIEKRS